MLDKLYITPKQWLRILRWTLYTLLFLLAMMLQTVVFGKHLLFGAKPDFVPVVITCVCLREGAERGGTFALLTSLLWCLSGADQGSLCIAVLTVVPIAGCLLLQTLVRNRFLPCLALTAVTLLVEQSVMFFLKYFFDNAAGVLFFERTLPCILVSLLAQPLTYWLVKRIGTIGDAYEST